MAPTRFSQEVSSKIVRFQKFRLISACLGMPRSILSWRRSDLTIYTLFFEVPTNSRRPRFLHPMWRESVSEKSGHQTRSDFRILDRFQHVATRRIADVAAEVQETPKSQPNTEPHTDPHVPMRHEKFDNVKKTCFRKNEQ